MNAKNKGNFSKNIDAKKSKINKQTNKYFF